MNSYQLTVIAWTLAVFRQSKAGSGSTGKSEQQEWKEEKVVGLSSG